MNHILEVGAALAAGSYPALSPNVFTDGFIYPLLKTGEDFTTFKWFDLMWERRTRQPLFNVIDNRMRVTGAKLLHDKVLEIVEEFGVDYFRTACREILERERQRALSFFKERSIPGLYEEINLKYTDTYQGRMSQLFPDSDKAWLLVRRTDCKINTHGDVTIDFEGSSSQDSFGLNVSQGGLRVGLSFWWIPLVMYGGVLNTAMNYVIDPKAPSGSVFNPNDPYLSSSMVFSTVTHILANLSRFQSRSMYSRGILEEAFVKEAGGCAIEQEGLFDNGVPWGFTYFSLIGADSTGARPYQDGGTLCAAFVNPQSDAGEDEEFELYMPPCVLLGKSHLPDSCGYGKYRGGLAMQVVFLVDNPGKVLRQASAGTGGGATYGGGGASGGYPGFGGWNIIFRDTNIHQLIESGEGYPSSLPEIQRWIEDGRLKVGAIDAWDADTPPLSLEHGDLYVCIACSMGGWGDPLDRNLDLVEKDLTEGWVGSEANRTVYGAVVEHIDGKWKVDREATAIEQQEIRRQRKKKSISARDWWRQQRHRVSNKDFPKPVYDMYSDILRYERFSNLFTTTWQLPEDYQP